MVSRDTAILVTVVLLAFASLTVLSPFVPDVENPFKLAALVAFNGAVLASVHLCLA